MNDFRLSINHQDLSLKHSVSVCFSPDVNHGHPWFDPAPDIGTNLPVGLGCLPEITPHLLVSHVQCTLLLTGAPPCCTAPEGFVGR